MPDPAPPKRDRNLASLRLARATSIDTTGFPLAPSRPRPVSPGVGSSSGPSYYDTPLARSVSHQPSSSASKGKSVRRTERIERWVEAAGEYELSHVSPTSRRLTSGMRKSFAIDEDDEDDDAESKGDRSVMDDEDDRPRRSRRRGVTFADEDTVELLPDDGMRLEEFERPRGRELFAIVTSCCVITVLSLTAGFATVYDWVL